MIIPCAADVNEDLRIPCGLQKISRPSLTKILSVCVSFKVP